MRAGEVLEPALMSVSKDITLGKILIQTNEVTGEPEVHTCTYCIHNIILYLNCERQLHDIIIILFSLFQLHFLRLPTDISECHVVLMDATVATGAAAMMAIRVLLVSYVKLQLQ